MPTAVVTTNEQDLEVLQRREALALKVKHAREQEDKQRAAADEFGQTLLDALKSGRDVAKTVSELADRLQQLTQLREQAERALAKFDKANEPPSVIQARVKQRQAEAEEAEREEARLKISRPLAEELMEAVRCSLKADATYMKFEQMFAAGKTPFTNNYDVRELCRTASRNMRQNDPKQKMLLEGGPGAEWMLGIAKRAAH